MPKIRMIFGYIHHLKMCLYRTDFRVATTKGIIVSLKSYPTNIIGYLQLFKGSFPQYS